MQSLVQYVRYRKLEELLKNKQFKEADYETYKLMIETVGKEEGQEFNTEDFSTFPCEDLRTLDQLWAKYSNGKFGFSIQQKIWLECGGKVDYNTEHQLGNRLGWCKDGKWVNLNYSDLSFKLLKTTPVGHLPIVLGHDGSAGLGVWYIEIRSSRITTCDV
ncbi:GUN4 domain-containing protein [Crocosphaera sp.]|uniref:GUN4 domain-containing protein n=1 Tax=Crocosphaera sp. TaxID=2729996 RepID=UPI003F267DF3|nr:GUN4 domain-containing protein [Crocosphaera sp.]